MCSIAVDHRRVSSDSSIHHSASVVTQPAAPPTHHPGTYATASYTQVHSRDVRSDPPAPFRHAPTSFGNVMVAGLKTPYSHVTDDAHVLHAKRPYTSGMPNTEVTAPKIQYTTELQNAGPNGAVSSRFDSHLPTDRFLTPLHPASRHNPDPGISHRLSNVFSLSAPNINIQPRPAYMRPLDARPRGDLDEPMAGVSLGAESFVSGDLGPITESVDLDRYLQLPGAFLDHEDPGGWAGRRDSCTMTAEVLSALSTEVAAECPAFTDNREVRPNTYPPPPPHPGPAYSSPPSTAGTFSTLLCGTGQESADRFTAVPSSSTGFVTTRPSAAPADSAASCMKVVANRLGISINPNDYQLLTDPHLSNYVTDETTEAQLLQ